MIKLILEIKIGNIILSVVLGLGLASLFRKVCKTNNCIIIKGSDPDLIKNNTFRYDKKCYKYSMLATDCKKNK